MFTKLYVADYQSIAEADLDLAPFTVIVGDNRSGKTALLRALRALVFNQSGNGFIRRGEPECMVEVTTSEGDIIAWGKTKTTAFYRLNDQDYSKMGGSVPDEVRDALGIRNIEVDATLTLTPQIARDTEQFFLLDRSAGQAARALAKMTKLDVVVRAQAICRAALKDVKDKLKIAVAKRESAEQELREFPDMDAWGAEIEALREKNEAVTGDVTRYNRAAGLVEVVARPVPPKVEYIDLDDTLTEIGWLHTYLSDLKHDVPADVGDISEAKTILERWAQGETAQRASVTAEWDVHESDAEYEMNEQEELRISKVLGAIKVCPTCGGAM